MPILQPFPALRRGIRRIAMAGGTNIAEMNAGGYRFNDFVRVGAPLTRVRWVSLSAFLSFACGP